jgi:ABC-type phosphate transport system substrate-binding protein
MARIPNRSKLITALFIILSAGIIMPPNSDAAEELRYSCSAQIYKALGKEAIEAFEKETGIMVNTHVTSSRVAVSRLMMDFSDIAGTTRPLPFKRVEHGYVQTPFCRDHLAVIVNTDCPLNDISSKNLKKVFRKEITNWKELGGMDREIFVVIPSTETGAFDNFDAQIMSHIELRYDFQAYKSTLVLGATRYIPNTISFIGYGVAFGQEGIKILSIDGRKPGEKAYPYGQVFSYVTRGKPTGKVKTFVDFVFTEKGKELIKRRGMDLVE